MKYQIEDIIQANGGFITRRELSTDWQYKMLLKMVREGIVLRVKPGVFALPESMANIMYDVEKIVPNSIVCSFSAWSHYGLTTQIPDGIYLAIDRNRKVRLPEHPAIHLVRTAGGLLELGVTTAEIGGYKCRIYDMERSVCDAVKQRNKIGIDVASEIVKSYLHRKGINIQKLLEYAAKMRISTTMTKYLEISL